MQGNQFKITPKREKRVNGTLLTPSMVVFVTTKMFTGNPFYNGAQEVIEEFRRVWGFDYRKAKCVMGDFLWEKVG